MHYTCTCKENTNAKENKIQARLKESRCHTCFGQEGIWAKYKLDIFQLNFKNIKHLLMVKET